MTGRTDERSMAMRCRGCAYDLRGQAEHRCPECGRGFDPAKPETFLQRPVNGLRLLGSLALSIACMIIPFVAGRILPIEPYLIWVVVIGMISQLGGLVLFWCTTASAVNVIRGRNPWAVNIWAVRVVAAIGGILITTVLASALGALVHDWLLN